MLNWQTEYRAHSQEIHKEYAALKREVARKVMVFLWDDLMKDKTQEGAISPNCLNKQRFSFGLIVEPRPLKINILSPLPEIHSPDCVVQDIVMLDILDF